MGTTGEGCYASEAVAHGSGPSRLEWPGAVVEEEEEG